MSRLIRHETCPECGSKDNLAIYDDHEYCFGSGCGYQKQYKDNDNKGGSAITKDKAKASGKTAKLHPVPVKVMPALKERGLDSSTVNKYQVSVSTNEENPIEAVFPRFSQSGEHVGNQVRYEDKGFSVEGTVKKLPVVWSKSFP